MPQIEIRNLRGIDSLDFDMPGTGVWLLTGENGCGKTTLLAVIRRIGFPNAFQTHFPASKESERLDDSSNSTILYRPKKEAVKYLRGDVRWVPTPRRNAPFLRDFGYPSVEFIGATPDRIAPREDDFQPTRIRQVSQRIIDTANTIFSTNRFDKLRLVNITRGQNPAYVFLHGSGKNVRYASEKSFSVGELCVLKLIKKVEECDNKSLLLIDELEMALHPSAQVELYHYLKSKAEAKELTVIFSTHSVTLIKTALRKEIIFLKRECDRFVAIKGPYPSVVLGSLASVEERSADIVVYVEDACAESIVEPMLSYVASEKFGENTFIYPKIVVVPVGGFREVVAFLKRHNALHRPEIRSFALLDEDVKTETLRQWRKNDNLDMLAWFKTFKGQIKYLPWSPEDALYSMCRTDQTGFRRELRDLLQDPALHLHRFDRKKLDALDGSKKRKATKRWYEDLVKCLCVQTAKDDIVVRKALGTILAKYYISENRDEALRNFGPMFT